MKTPAPAGFEDIQRDELSSLFGRITHIRLAIVPVVVALVAWLFIHPVTPWRRAVLVSLGLFAIGVFVHEVVHHRRHGLGRRAFAVNFVFAAVAQVTGVLATGGLESPILFVMFIVTMIGAVIVERKTLLLMIGVQTVALWAMVWVEANRLLPHMNPAPFGGDAVEGWSPAHLAWAAGLASLGLGVIGFLGRGIRGSFDRMLRRGIEAREEVLQTHAERARELSALSSEIAHELKNPLASIKGLSALLAQDAPAGKPAERLHVLRREVDRMQGILDEFLNFSRPLVPLAVQMVDAAVLVADVADMHEGMAHEHEVRLTVRAHAAPVDMRCDARKIKQALINLVQNALEASPPHSVVEIEAEPQAGIGQRGVVCLRVADRGPGLAPALCERVFDPGVTTKPNGSGLGLTIARALARQHGGEITLAARDGGGCLATLRLPREMP